MRTILKITLKYIAICILIANLTSCCKTVDCEPGYLDIATINFTREQSDTFIIRRYKVNTNFNVLVDTLLVARNVNAYYRDMGLDTSSVLMYDSNPFKVNPGFDYVIFFPATNTIRKISDIKETKNQQTLCLRLKRCFNDINSYKVDGLLGNRSYISIYK